jgi:hypothetical protein
MAFMQEDGNWMSVWRKSMAMSNEIETRTEMHSFNPPQTS